MKESPMSMVTCTSEEALIIVKYKLKENWEKSADIKTSKSTKNWENLLI